MVGGGWLFCVLHVLGTMGCGGSIEAGGVPFCVVSSGGIRRVVLCSF